MLINDRAVTCIEVCADIYAKKYYDSFWSGLVLVMYSTWRLSPHATCMMAIRTISCQPWKQHTLLYIVRIKLSRDEKSFQKIYKATFTHIMNPNARRSSQLNSNLFNSQHPIKYGYRKNITVISNHFPSMHFLTHIHPPPPFHRPEGRRHEAISSNKGHHQAVEPERNDIGGPRGHWGGWDFQIRHMWRKVVEKLCLNMMIKIWWIIIS